MCVKIHFHNQLICQWPGFSYLVLGSQRQYILAGINGLCVKGLVSPLPVSTAYSNGKGGRRGKKEQDERKRYGRKMYSRGYLRCFAFSTPTPASIPSSFSRSLLSWLPLLSEVWVSLSRGFDTDAEHCCFFFFKPDSLSRATPRSKHSLDQWKSSRLCGGDVPQLQ